MAPKKYKVIIIITSHIISHKVQEIPNYCEYDIICDHVASAAIIIIIAAMT